MSAGDPKFVFGPFDRPAFGIPRREPRRHGLSWEAVVGETAPLRSYYLEHFDSAAKRLREKSPLPFRIGG